VGCSSKPDYGTSQGPGDALDRLDLRDGKLPERIDARGLHAHDHVVGPGHDIGGAHSLKSGQSLCRQPQEAVTAPTVVCWRKLMSRALYQRVGFVL
jgi:hypothetical protein